MEWRIPYSTIYLEEGVEKYPTTHKVLECFPRAKLITIPDYKQVFNKPNQNFQIQKKSPKLILAKKKNHFLYKGSELAPNFGEENFYYNSLVLNCPYNCSYCYLQGMYNSGNIVLFVNLEDFFQETQEVYNQLGRLYLCLSYDTDLLALEKWTGYVASWIDFAKDKPNLILELRTKSANVKVFEQYEPISNLILAWTLSPQEIIEKYEKKTPSLQARLTSILFVHELGWKTRICLDPLLYVPNWRSIYERFLWDENVQQVFKYASEISVGTFRIHHEFMERLEKLHPGLDLLQAPFVREENSIQYPLEIRNQVLEFVIERITNSKCIFPIGQSLPKTVQDLVVK